MAGYIGKIDPFDDSIETWTSYVERLEQYFKANKVENDMKVPALLSLIGGKTYSLLRDLTSPEKPADKNFEDIVKLLKDHLSPKPSVIAERFRFNRRQQLDGESVNEYVVKLRKLAEHCEFGENLSDTLRDRIVCGLNNEQIQRQLSSKSTLTLQKAIDIAVGMETASKDAQELRHKQVSVNKLSQQKKYHQKPKSPQPSNCIHCNGKNHDSADCYFKSAVCRKCNKTGHIIRACGITGKGKQKFKPRKQKKFVRNVDQTSDDGDSSCEIEKLSINSVIKTDDQPWLKEIKLDWKNVKSIMTVATEKPESKRKIREILQKYSSVFADGIGKVHGIKANLHLIDDVKAIFCKARSVPYALKPKIEQKLGNLENMGVLEKVDTSEWATPIVPVPKKNGKVRICGDFKVTLNPQLNVDQYPLPKIEDIFASLSNGEHFSKIDLRQAYLHMEMEEKSKAYLTINTHKGLIYIVSIQQTVVWGSIGTINLAKNYGPDFTRITRCSLHIR